MLAGRETPPCLQLRAHTWLPPLDGPAKWRGGGGGSTVSLCTNGAFVHFPRTSRGSGCDRGGGARRRRSGWGSHRSVRPTARVQRQTLSGGAPGLFLLRMSEKTKLNTTATFYLLGRRPQDSELTLLYCFRACSRLFLQPSFALKNSFLVLPPCGLYLWCRNASVVVVELSALGRDENVVKNCSMLCSAPLILGRLSSTADPPSQPALRLL